VTAAGSRLRVLHLGPLDSVHLRRWLELCSDLGHEAVAAGHLRSGFDAAALPAGVAGPFRSPQLPWASRRRAMRTASRADRLVARLPNAMLEVPLCAAWVRRLARRIRPDVVHAHWLPHWCAAAALAGVHPLVVGAFGSDVYTLDRVRRRLADHSLSGADAVIAPSPHAASALARRPGRNGRCLHLEPGVDLAAFRPATAAKRRAARAELGLGEGPVVLSFRGSARVYDLPLVAGSFALARRAVPSAQLLVVHGPLPLDRATRSALAGLDGSVRVLGCIRPEEMPRVFNAADVGVSVPRSDGSPASVWESLACEVPVVASDLPHLVERVGEGDGVVAVARRPEAVAEELVALMADGARARALGAAGRTWCEKHMDRPRAGERLGRLYAELARR
jgi:L-malate glycosyltransferase